jgi:zinc protease
MKDIERVEMRYFAPDRATVTIVWPPGAKAQAPAVDAKGARPAARKIMLETGLDVVLVPMPGSKSVAIDAFFAGGVRGETPETGGTLNLLAKTLVRGTEGRPPAQLAAEVDALGGSLGAECGYSSIGVSAGFLAEDLDRGLDIVADVLAHPSFPEAEVAREKRIALAAIAALDDDWQAEGVNLFREALFAPHPYALRPIGTAKVVEKVDRARLLEAWKATVNPRIGVLALAGDFAPEVAEAAVRKRLAGFRALAPAAAPLPPPPPGLPEPKEVVKRTGKGQTTIVLGYPGISAESGDRFALDVIDAVTSGIGLPSGWLHNALRGGDRSLVYFVHAIPWYGLDGGAYYILTRCNPEDEGRVLDLARGVQRRIVEAEITDEDLERGKSIALTAHAIDRETPGERAREAAIDELLGLGHDWGDRYPDRIRAVTKADVARVARRLFGPAILAVVRPNAEVR